MVCLALLGFVFICLFQIYNRIITPTYKGYSMDDMPDDTTEQNADSGARPSDATTEVSEGGSADDTDGPSVDARDVPSDQPRDDGDVASFDALDGAFNLGAQAAPADEPQVIDPSMLSFDTNFDIDFLQGGAHDPFANDQYINNETHITDWPAPDEVEIDGTSNETGATNYFTDSG